MTETTKVALPASVKSTRKKHQTKPPLNSEVQRTNARKRWKGVDAETRSESMREIAKKRWASSNEMDAATKTYFETEDLDTAMESYQEMRRTYEMVGKLLDQRFQNERQSDEKCSNPECGNKFDREHPWYYRNAERNPISGAPYNVFACSPRCMVAIKGVGTQHRPRG